MDKIKNLTEEYKNSADMEKKVMNIFSDLYLNLERFGIIIPDEDIRNDFLLEFYYKIPRILNLYDPKKAAFSTYLSKSLKFSFLTFKFKNKTKNTAYQVLENDEEQKIYTGLENVDEDEFRNCYTSDLQTVYGKEFTEKVSDSVNFNCKRLSPKEKGILLLACKSCLFLNDDMILKIAKTINMPYITLSNIILNLRKACYKRHQNINTQINRRNEFYLKMRLYKIIFESCEENSDGYRRYKKAYIYNLNSWKRAISINKAQIKSPSNRLIGKHLHISRGTVDKNLAKALKKCYSLDDENLFGFR